MVQAYVPHTYSVNLKLSTLITYILLLQELSTYKQDWTTLSKKNEELSLQNKKLSTDNKNLNRRLADNSELVSKEETHTKTTAELEVHESLHTLIRTMP